MLDELGAITLFIFSRASTLDPGRDLLSPIDLTAVLARACGSAPTHAVMRLRSLVCASAVSFGRCPFEKCIVLYAEMICRQK